MRTQILMLGLGTIALCGLPAAHAGSPSALYDQLDNDAGNGAPDQDFESAFDAYDSMGADDFVVPATRVWTVTQIETGGTTGTPGGATVDVTFYANAPGGGDPDLPGTVVCTATDVVPTTDSAGSLVIDLAPGCVLGEGTYWVGIQVNQNFGSFGQHFWSVRSVQAGSKGVWMNPGNGFGTGCATFTPMMTCGVAGGTNPDFRFAIRGTDVEATTTTISVVTTTTTTTTTVPSDPCDVVAPASFDGLGCRIQDLVNAMAGRARTSFGQERFARRLERLVNRHAKALEHCAAGDAAKAASWLRLAERRIDRLVTVLDRKDMDLDEAAAASLRVQAETIQALLAERRAALACPGDAATF